MEHKSRLSWRLIATMITIILVRRAQGVCIEEERNALLEIKASLMKTYDFEADRVLSTWVDYGECCDWERVKCNTTTGHVTTLSLSSLEWKVYDGMTPDLSEEPKKKLWPLNVSIFLHFQELRYLNLSWNYLDNRILSTEIKRLSSLKKLAILDLSSNFKIDNDILPSLTTLTSLRVLDLGYTSLEGHFPTKEFAALENLEMLDLSNCAFNDIFQMQGIEKDFILNKLETLILNQNGFNESIISSLKVLPSIRSLDLSGNDLSGPFPPKELAHLTTLEKLDLSNNWLTGTPEIQGCKVLSRMKKLKSIALAEINFIDIKSIVSCLKVLPSLKILDLSSSIGSESSVAIQDLASLHKLEVLDLSGNFMVGNIPSAIQALSSLRVVSFANNRLNGTLPEPGFCELKSLQELDLSQNMLNGNLPECLNKLSSLKLLDISSNNFTGMPSRSLIENLTSLEYVDLSHNNFEGTFSFSSFSNTTNLEMVKFINDNDEFEVETEDPIGWIPSFELKFLMLTNCNMNKYKGSVIPSFLVRQNKLRVLDLSHNSLEGQFPNWLIENNTMLEVLNLRNNSLNGTIHLPLSKNSNTWWFDISSNQITGTIPEDIQNLLPYVALLNLSRNAISGEIPSSIGNLTELFVLDLSDNDLSGEVPKGLFTNTSRLTILNLSKNRLHGDVLSGNLTMGQIEMLYLGGNSFTGKIGNVTSNFLNVLDIRDNFFTGMVPGWISNMPDTSELVMSNNTLEGPFPCGTTSFSFLDISQNSFSGPIPSCLSLQYVEHFHFGSNRFTGSIPNSFRNLTNVITLDIGNNLLSGRIPKFLGEFSNLRILLLGRNNFSGSIPKQLCKLSTVSMIDLSSNSLSGSIPSCLQIITGPSYLYTIPVSIFSYPRDLFYEYGSVLGKVLSVHNDQEMLGTLEEVEFTTKSMSRNFKGNVLDYMTGLDLSSNKLRGEIPEELGLLTEIHTLNLSNNYLIGPIPVNLSNLVNIESLDLSSNRLSGNIPSQLMNLDYISVFNVSRNNLSGRLPDMKGQFGTFTATSFEDNPLLCGPPLEKSCTTNSPPLVTTPLAKEEADKWYDIDMVWFFWSLSSSWVVFLLGFVAALYANPYWRRRWLHFVEESMYTCYYFVCDLVLRPSILLHR